MLSVFAEQITKGLSSDSVALLIKETNISAILADYEVLCTYGEI